MTKSTLKVIDPKTVVDKDTLRFKAIEVKHAARFARENLSRLFADTVITIIMVATWILITTNEDISWTWHIWLSIMTTWNFVDMVRGYIRYRESVEECSEVIDNIYR